jgi:hypothetical protein
MKKIPFVSLVLAGLFAACADSPTEPMSASPSFGVSSPNAPVTVVITIPGAGGYWLGGGVPSNGGNDGLCVTVNGEPGYFQNPHGHIGSNRNEGQCWLEGSGTASTITFHTMANHVVTPSGNVQLNFGLVCDPADPTSCSDTFVHYRKNQNRTSGGGTLFGSGYYVVLGGINAAGNLLAQPPLFATACTVDGGTCYPGAAAISW